MSLKAGWDDGEERLVARCQVLAAWQGLRLERRRRGWAICFAEDRVHPPLARGLTIGRVEAYLLGLTVSPPRRRMPSPRQLAPA